MSDHDVRRLISLTDELALAESITDASRTLSRFAVADLHADVAWLSLRHSDGTLSRPHGADPVLEHLDVVGYELGGGPGGVPLANQAMLTIDDTRFDQRWPAWGAAADAMGVRSIRRVGLPLMRESLLSYDLYARRPGAFADAEFTIRAAAAAGLALVLLDRIANLGEAMQTRALIAQAQGILMERHSLPADSAMGYLRRMSREAQVKVRDLATEIVDGRERDAGQRGGSGEEPPPGTT